MAASTLLDYTLDDTTVSNPDGSFELTFADAAVVPGPGVTVAGDFPDRSTSARSVTALSM